MDNHKLAVKEKPLCTKIKENSKLIVNSVLVRFSRGRDSDIRRSGGFQEIFQKVQRKWRNLLPSEDHF